MRLTEDNYKELVDARNNIGVSDSPEEARNKMLELDKEMDRLIAAKELGEEGLDEAISIIAQGRNFFAMEIGEEQREITLTCYQESQVVEIPDPIEERYVAVCVFDNQGCFENSLNQSLSIMGLKYKIFSDTKAMIDALEAGDVCGIVGIHAIRKGGMISERIRHDMKYHSSFGFDAAKDYIFPPCADFSQPLSLLQLTSTIWQMLKGEFTISKDDEFSPVDQICELIPHMVISKEKISVAIVDDVEAEIQTMLLVLIAWPGVSVEFIQVGKEIPEISQDFDILLLDEAMPALSGTLIAKQLESSGCQSQMASISGGSCPSFTKDHFNGKIPMKQSRQACLDFVRFMNTLISRV